MGLATSIQGCLLAVVVYLLVGAHADVTLSSTRVAFFSGRGCVNLLRHRRAVDDGVGACSYALKNKGGGPRLPTCAKKKIYRLSAPSIWLECHVPECFAGKLH
jgi:hypothetical protein